MFRVPGFGRRGQLVRATVIVDNGAIFRMDVGFYMGVISWPLLKS